MPNMSNDNRIVSILNGTECKKHKAPTGLPCFTVKYGNSFGYAAGVCGKRIRLAGFVGKISPTALRQKAANGRSKRS